MRKKWILVLLLAFGSLCASAQSMEDIMQKYRSGQYVETMSVSGTVIKELAERDDNDILRKLTSIKLISMKNSEGSGPVAEFSEDIASLMSAGYEELLSFSSGDAEVRICINGKRTEVLLLTQDTGEIALMCLRGNIDSVVIEALLNNEISIK